MKKNNPDQNHPIQSKINAYFAQFDDEVNFSQIPTVDRLFMHLGMTPEQFKILKADDHAVDLIYSALMEIKRALYFLLIDTLDRVDKVALDYEIIKVAKRELLHSYFFSIGTTDHE